MGEYVGWLLDQYANSPDGIVLWFLDGSNQPRRLHQPFPITFYAAGADERLRDLWRFLRNQPISVELDRVERRDLFKKHPVPVLAVQVQQPAEQPRLFHQVSRSFPDLTYYDADIPLALRYSAIYGTFPMAHCRVEADTEGVIERIHALDSPWDLMPEPPPLRLMTLKPDCDPFHEKPRQLTAQYGRANYHLPLEPERSLLVNFISLLRRHDPDILMTAWGDTWLLPHLLEISKKMGIPLPLNREPGRNVLQRPERVYFAYGQVIYRGQQVRFFGRGHIDVCNAVLFGDYGLDGVLEMARVTGLPLQGAARLSPGTGISSMQIVTALRSGILVPWHKQQAESPKTALDLVNADRGGLVFQPRVGLHHDVGEIDFISMYPSVMAHFNISPETVGKDKRGAQRVPELNIMVDFENPGLVPETLRPLLDKRLALKAQLPHMPKWDPRRKQFKARASAHKWLLVTCFGYLGYKNARFGRIEAHEAVTAYGREALLRAKEASEDRDFAVLHMYVDGFWVKRDGASQVKDFQPLLDEILERTGLPVALEGVYKWIAFLPSRVDSRVPVANRYFGAYQDGTLKIRGIEARRRDTPPFIALLQMDMLKHLARAHRADELIAMLPDLVELLKDCLVDLRTGRIALEKMLVAQKLSRTLDEYTTPSPGARAARQLRSMGRELRTGQRVRFLYTLGEPGVYAWDLPVPPKHTMVNKSRYIELILRAANTVMQPLGVDETTLRHWMMSNAGYSAPPGVLPKKGSWADLPLWMVDSPHSTVKTEQNREKRPVPV